LFRRKDGVTVQHLPSQTTRCKRPVDVALRGDHWPLRGGQRIMFSRPAANCRTPECAIHFDGCRHCWHIVDSARNTPLPVSGEHRPI